MSTSFVLTPASYTSAPTPPKTILERYQDDLRPELVASFDKTATHYQVADTATLVAFAVLAVGGLIATGLYAPVFVPVTGISAMLLLEPIGKVRQSFEKQSKQATGRANQLRAFNGHYQTLAQSTPAQLQQILEQKGIYVIPGMQRNDPRLTTLKPLIARHMFWEEHVDKLQKKTAEKLSEAAQPGESDDIKRREEIFALRSIALEWEREALEAKCKNAFISAVIRNPAFTGTFDDMGSFSPLSGKERAVDAAHGVAGTQQFFTFKKQGDHIHPVQRSQTHPRFCSWHTHEYRDVRLTHKETL